MARGVVRGALRQVNPRGPTLVFDLNPESVVDTPAIGGWTEIARPLQDSALEWSGRPLRKLQFSLVFDGFERGRSVESRLEVLESMARPAGHRRPPPRLQLLYGPVADRHSVWVITALEYGDEIRNKHLQRVMAQVTVTLARFRSPTVVDLTPADRNGKGGGGGGGGGGGNGGGGGPPTHKPPLFRATALAGDTLARVAARELGDASRWPEIAELNGIRDPRAVTVGQVLSVPRS